MPVTVPGITQPIAADTNVNGEAVQRINVDAPVLADPVAVNAASVNRKPAQAAELEIAAANINRRGLIVYNDSPTSMLVKYGAGVTATSFTVRIMGLGYWEMPHALFVGAITGLWENATPTGAALVTEL